MAKVLLDMAVSLDGFISGPNNDDGGLHDWYFSETGKSHTKNTIPKTKTIGINKT